MRKLGIIVASSVALIIALIAVAFFYIDLSGHKEFHYDLLVDDEILGTVEVDRYVTEGKKIYKKHAKHTYSTEYPLVDEKMYFKKGTMVLERFLKEATGTRGQKQVTMLARKGNAIDFLFFEQPRFIALKDSTRYSETMVFSPDDVMLYMPIMETYNFWQKGSQFFDIMIIVDEPVPPIKENVEVKYFRDEYIAVMGRRQEAESYIFSAEGLPEAKIFVSKYSRIVLAVEVEKLGIRFVLTAYNEGLVQKIKPTIQNIVDYLKKIKERTKADKNEGIRPKVEAFSKDGYSGDAKSLSSEKKSASIPEEVFFKSDTMVYSAKLWTPEGEGPFPGVIAVPDDGPRTKGEEGLFDSLAESLVKAGFSFLIFDSQGQGKSQGDFILMNDDRRIQGIVAACSYLGKQENIKKKSITLMGYGDGGFLALKAAALLKNVSSCILLEMSLGVEKTIFSCRVSVNKIGNLLSFYGLGPFNGQVMEDLASDIEKHLKSVASSAEDHTFFLGVKLPVKGCNDVLARSPYKTILSSTKPLLLIFGQDSKNFDSQAVNGLKRSIRDKKPKSQVALFRNLGRYLGGLIRHKNKRTFLVKEDVLDLVKSWMRDNDVMVKKNVQSGIVKGAQK